MRQPGVQTIAKELALGLLPLIGLLAGMALLELLAPVVIVVAGGLYLLTGGLMVMGSDGVPPGFGWANRVTLLRAVIVVVLAAAMFAPDLYRGGSWLVAGLAGLALALDGVDGQLARQFDQTSNFGARFDMEVDAALILVLCLGLVIGGMVGTWVVFIGLMRYGFLLGMVFWSWLTVPLPESFRRKVICVWQVASLMVAMLPITPGWLAFTGLVGALLLLIASFAIDIHWLWQQRNHRLSKLWS